MEKITVFEAFAGYGSQSMALERLKQDIGLDYTVVGISEIDATAIKAYYAARDTELLSRCRIVGDVETAIRGGYEPPQELIDRYPNYGDICKINWANVPDFNLFTYSFPCTDISKPYPLEKNSDTELCVGVMANKAVIMINNML